MSTIEVSILPSRIRLEPMAMAELIDTLTEYGVKWTARAAEDEPQPDDIPPKGQEATLLEFVRANPGLSAKEIEAACPGIKCASAGLSDLLARRFVTRTGSRKRSDPYRYYVPGDEARNARPADTRQALREELAQAAE